MGLQGHKKTSLPEQFLELNIVNASMNKHL